MTGVQPVGKECLVYAGQTSFTRTGPTHLAVYTFRVEATAVRVFLACGWLDLSSVVSTLRAVAERARDLVADPTARERRGPTFDWPGPLSRPVSGFRCPLCGTVSRHQRVCRVCAGALGG